MDLKSKIILVYGPTASGKSEFAVRLAKKIKGEIINADSLQIYKDLKILTNRPSKKNFQQVKHHLYGFQKSNTDFSTGNWLKFATNKIYNIKKKKKIPILIGGTGLYFKALTEGLVEIPFIPLKLRNKVRIYQKSVGQKKFYQKLLETDPLVKGKIELQDTQRSIRAFEVKKFTKKSIFDWFKNTKPIFKKNEFYKLYIDYPRTELIKKIMHRTTKMMDQGAILEVKKFLKLKISKNKTISKAIGIYEIEQYVKKKMNKDEVIEKISIKTRQYAKRQATWARGNMKSWKKIKHKQLSTFLKKI